MYLTFGHLFTVFYFGLSIYRTSFFIGMILVSFHFLAAELNALRCVAPP